MPDEKTTSCPGGQLDIIQCAIEDAERMIYFATQERINAPEELKCLENLVKATFKVKATLDNNTDATGDIKAEFLKQLAIMSHALYPVTSKSLRLLERSCPSGLSGVQKKHGGGIFRSLAGKIKRGVFFSPSLTVVTFLATLCLLCTIYILGFSLTGADILEKLDGLIKERAALRRDLVVEAQEYKPAANHIPYKAITIIRSMSSSSTRMAGLIDHLGKWNNSFIGEAILFLYRFGEKGEQNFESSSNGQNRGSPSPVLQKSEETEAGKNFICDHLIEDGDYQKCLQQEIEKKPVQFQEKFVIKNKGLLIFSVLNNCLLPIMFGLSGAFAYVLRKAFNELRSHAFEGVGGSHVMLIRILLGAISGFFLGYLMQSNDFVNLLSSEGGSAGASPTRISLASPFTLAFIGGYSVDILYNILNRFIYALTNDERYLPANELQKRKVDVGKFLPSGASGANEVNTGKEPQQSQP